MAFSHGKKQTLRIDNAGGSLVDIRPYLTDISVPNAIEMADVTTLVKNSKCVVVGIEDNKISCSGKWDPTLDALITGLKVALRNGTLASASFEYGPGGNASGAVKWTGECFVSNYEVSGGTGSAQEFSLEFQVSDDVTYGTFS